MILHTGHKPMNNSLYNELLNHVLETVEGQFDDFDYGADKLENYDGEEYTGQDDWIDAEESRLASIN